MAMHRINRVEVELHSREVALARALSERVGRMHGDRIAPVLDRVCSELGGIEVLVRIDRLELDLGTFAADDLEEAFVARLEPALRAALARALGRIAGDPRVQASLEVLETFALTGGLPWWVPPEGDVVARHFARATVEAEADLVTLLGRVAHDPGALDRIARMCDRDALVALAERAQVDRQLPGGSDQDERRILLSALAARGCPRNAAVRSAARRAVTEPVRDPSAARKLPPAPGRSERDAWGHADLDDGARSASPPTDDEAREPRLSAASRLTDDGSRGWQRADPALLDERPCPAPGTAAGVRSSDRPPARDAMVERGSAAPPPTDDAPLRRSTPTLRSPVPTLAAAPAVPRRILARSSTPATIRAARRGALARLDEVYVEDAGLVILWPFLERFFVRTGVLGDDRRFFDDARQLQAVALVEILATGDPAPPEFRLPLAKLLCGRPLESDFHLERPLTPEQLAEGDRLLAAVIDPMGGFAPRPAGRAVGIPTPPLASLDRDPAPEELSIASFRAGFLARPGALGTRDGAWLLQVERRPHDAVLDRLPWSWGWVKLPWMPEPLRVEW